MQTAKSPAPDARHAPQEVHGRPYLRFWINMALGLVVMYLVMFSMIDTGADYRNNINMLYMAVTMWAPMGIFMLATMPAMLSNRPLNIALHLVFALLTAGAFFATRWQVAVGDHQFIASMVPHHSGAILMCREARLADPELLALCESIAKAQRSEIEQMNRIAERLQH
ncbi:DUF305 domain-containing protein [Hydrogenophaga borbori]|uniref:DUF305 domain-containing protein n=2 Tax=Hydrogenophaga TaxID=47420 RepID=A0A372EP07_9BURK|nr:DUF305 domain-containing protein [Hydrogenophaga borbori]RFP82350.1 DUF305 domain-containing protein [Hydrogenophaga borbori]